MCGHVGVAGVIDRHAMKAFKQMLFIDTLRGEHGTGVAFVPFAKANRDEPLIIKAPIPAYDLMRNDAFDTAVSATSHSVVIGHNRHATLGAHIHENTHPFDTDGIVGAHNGTVSRANRSDLEKKGEWGTDSEEILNNISEFGADQVIPKLTSDTDGAWALVWYDKYENSINFIRNDYRPFYYAFSEDRRQLFWASEASMLHLCLTRCNIKYKKVMALPVDKLMTMEVPSTHSEIFNSKPYFESMAGKEPVRRNYGYYQQGVWHPYDKNNSKSSSSNKDDKKSFPSAPNTPLGASLDIALVPFELSEKEVQALFSKGTQVCAYCSIDVDKKDIKNGKAIAISKESVICPDCVEDSKAACSEAYSA